MSDWYVIDNIDQLDSPALVVYPERVRENIKILKQFVPDTQRLRPHVKTNKCIEVCKLMMEAGIQKFKTATIAESEMLASIGAHDVLFAYQPVGPKADRLIQLIRKFHSTKFSCLIDNLNSATKLSESAITNSMEIPVYIDINVGMNRTGISPDAVMALFEAVSALPGLTVEGLHAYDGHLRDTDLEARKLKCDECFRDVEELHKRILEKSGKSLTIIAGGTPTFPIHAQRSNVECSPGTFIFWDKGYQQLLPEQPFLFASLVIARVISKPADDIITVDLGHKAIASENPINNRVYFLNAPEVQAIGHSEEHLVLKTSLPLQVGDVLYGVPYHICPTVALHETMSVIKEKNFGESWQVVARKRKITI